MKNQIYLFFAVCLLSFSLQAQNLNMKWGPEFVVKDGNKGLVGKTKDAFYTLRIEDKQLFLSKYRTSDMSLVFLKPVKGSKIERKGADDELAYWNFMQIGTNFILLSTDVDKKLDKEIVYGQIFDMDGNPKGQHKELASRTKFRRSKDGAFSYEISDDSSKVLILEYPPYEKYENEEYKFKIFDSSLNQVYNFGAAFPYKNKNFSLKDFNISNDGMIVMLSKIFLESKEKKKGEEGYYYQMVTINPNNKNEVKQYDINLDKKYIEEAMLILDKAHNFKCVGVYSDMKDNGRAKNGINGSFYVAIDKKTGKVGSKSTKEFSKDLILELEGKRRANKDKGLESSFNIVEVLEKEDGGSQIIMEDSWVETRTTCTSSSSGGRSCTTTYYYHNNDLLIINIDGKGQINNYVTIPKKQVTTDDGGIFNSIYATRYKGKSYLIFNDSKNNTGTTFTDSFTKSKRDGIFVFVVSDNGSYTRMPLMIEGLKKKEFFVICPYQVDRIKDNEAILYGYKLKRKCCFGKAKTMSRYGYLTIQ